MCARKIERSSLARKVYGVGERERGKMVEGLRLGLASASIKNGKNNTTNLENLAKLNGKKKLLVEETSPPQHTQVGANISKFNLFTTQDQLIASRSVGLVR